MSIFRIQRNDRLNKRFVFFILVLSILVLVFFMGPGKSTPSFFQHPVLYVGYLIETTTRSVINVISGVWNGYLNLVHVQEKFEKLTRDYDLLKGENSRLQESLAENQRLRLLLELPSPVPMKLTAAQVIMRDPTNWYQSLTINKGTSAGIFPGMGVVSPNGVVGRVIKAGARSAVVLLVTDRNSAVAVLIGRTRDEGILEGTAGGLARIKYLSPELKLVPGDPVLTSGLTPTFPKGLVIGTVSRAGPGKGARGDSPSDPFLSVEVFPSVNFSRLEEVTVITTFKPLPDEEGGGS